MKLMTSWHKLNKQLSKITDEEIVLKMLRDEKSGPHRSTFLKRLHQRYTRLRATRERREL